MSDITNAERFRKPIIQTILDGQVRLEVGILLTLGKKNKSDIKLNFIHTREYASKKYADHDTLKEVEVSIPGQYISFKYTSFENASDIDNMEVLVSYPHMDTLIDFLEAAYSMALDEDDQLYNKKNVLRNDDAKNATVVSGDLVQGKYLIAMPASIEFEEQNKCERGIYLFLNEVGTESNRGGQDRFVTITLNQLYGMYNRIANLDLSIESDLTALLCMTGVIASEGASSEGEPSSSRRNPTRRAVVPPRSRNNGTESTGRPSRAPMSRRAKNKPVEDDTEEPEIEDDDDMRFDEEEETTVKPSRKSTKKSAPSRSNKKTTSKVSSKRKSTKVEEDDEDEEDENTSFNALMEAAESIEYDEDEEIEFDDDEE